MALTSAPNTAVRATDIIEPRLTANALIRAGALTVVNANGYAASDSASNALAYAGRAEEAVDTVGQADY